MAYVDIPKDLDGIKSKVALGLTKKQLIGFGVAAVIGVPFYLATRLAVGNDVGLFFMMFSMALPLLYAIYEPKGITMGQLVAIWLRFQFIAIGARPYKNANLYEVLTDESEVTTDHAKGQNTISGKAGSQKR